MTELTADPIIVVLSESCVSIYNSNDKLNVIGFKLQTASKNAIAF